MRKRRRTPTRLLAGLVGLLAVVAAADRLFPPPIARGQVTSPVVLDRNGQWLHAFTTEDGRWRFQTKLDEIDAVFVERLIAIEDKRFFRHWGVDLVAILRAGAASARAGKIVSGASTITMQTARLLEPRPRTFYSKAIEMIRALQIERRLSKTEILELYLTLAPYGGNIEGVRAASLVYFDKEPARLTDAEQALLIALPQAPEARRPDLKAGNARAARQAVLNKLARLGAIEHLLATEAGEAALPIARHSFPRLAYHAAQGLTKETSGVIKTSLDRELQAQAEALLGAYAERLDDDATASLLIVENETRAVRAAVGSSGFDVKGGWIDLTAATRSPGSTLKPFIYAIAFEDGLAGPATVIDDMPRSFGGYSPENFDRTFRGEVRVREALQHSLNVPAVRALDRIGAARFAALLKAAGIGLKTPVRADNDPGLAIALGGAGVTAREIAQLYAALGDGGQVRALEWNAGGGMASDRHYQLMTAQTAARISYILATGPALKGRAPSELSKEATRVAFKTGTSYGYRDAWAAGHGGGYTVVVWVGRADGAPRPGQTGRKAAAPLLFDVFDMLERQRKSVQGAMIVDNSMEAENLERFDRSPLGRAPEIVFPRDGVEVFLGSAERGFALSARGIGYDYRWYVDGEPLARDAVSGRAVWRPSKAGFYDVSVVDENGQTAKSKVRVVAG